MGEQDGGRAAAGARRGPRRAGRARRCPGSTTTHCSPGAGGHDVAVGAEGLGREAGDEHAAPLPSTPSPLSLSGARAGCRAGRRPVDRSDDRRLPGPLDLAHHLPSRYPYTLAGVWRGALRPRTAGATRRKGAPGGFQQGPAAQARAGEARPADGPPGRRGAAGAAIQAGVGAALALILIVVGGVSGRSAASTASRSTPAADDVCAWTPQDAPVNTDLKDVGTPPTDDIPTSGTRPMTITTNQGRRSPSSWTWPAAPCAGASLAYLAARSSTTTPSATRSPPRARCAAATRAAPGRAGRRTAFSDENVPAARAVAQRVRPRRRRPRRRVPEGHGGALIANPPGTNGSQFLIFFKDFAPAEPKYPIVGTVTGRARRGRQDRQDRDRRQRQRRQGQAEDRRDHPEPDGRRAPDGGATPTPSVVPVGPGLAGPVHCAFRGGVELNSAQSPVRETAQTARNT